MFYFSPHIQNDFFEPAMRLVDGTGDGKEIDNFIVSLQLNALFSDKWFELEEFKCEAITIC